MIIIISPGKPSLTNIEYQLCRRFVEYGLEQAFKFSPTKLVVLECSILFATKEFGENLDVTAN